MMFAVLLLVVFLVIPLALAIHSTNKLRKKNVEALDILDKLRGTDRHRTSSTGPH